jgi:sugar transferase (PEP-CTERM/EpsH1 system associated)
MTPATFTGSAVRPKVLFLAHRVPFPPDKGDRIRSWNMLRYLSRRCDVWLGCLADEPWSPATDIELNSLCRGFRIVPLDATRWFRGALCLAQGKPITSGMFSSPQLRQWIREISQQVSFDVVLAYCSSMADYLQLPEIKHVPHIVDLVDVDSEKWLAFSRDGDRLGRMIYGLEGTRLRRLEQELGQRAHAVTFVSQPEADLYRGFAPDASIQAVCNGVSLDYFQRPANQAAAGREVVFIGALDYRPNVEGVTWFCEHVWPHIVQAHPEAVFRIVGRRPTAAVKGLARLPGVMVHGDVPDIRPYLFDARVSIAPLKVARGVQNKILESMACETPVVATPEALLGIDVSAGEDLLLAEGAPEWTAAISKLLHDEAACRKLAARGRAYVERHCDWSQTMAPLGRMVHDLADGRSDA